MKTVFEHHGERFVLTHPCWACKAEIEDGDLCERCAQEKQDADERGDNGRNTGGKSYR